MFSLYYKECNHNLYNHVFLCDFQEDLDELRETLEQNMRSENRSTDDHDKSQDIIKPVSAELLEKEVHILKEY